MTTRTRPEECQKCYAPKARRLVTNFLSFLGTISWWKGRQVREWGFFHLLLGLLPHRRDCLPQPWKEWREMKRKSLSPLSCWLHSSCLVQNVAPVGLLQDVWSLYFQLFLSMLELVSCRLVFCDWLKACLIFIFFANSLCCIDFLIPNNVMLQSGHSEKQPFSFSIHLLWWYLKNMVIFETSPVCQMWLAEGSKTWRGRDSDGQRLICICLKRLKECVACLCKKCFIKTACPISVSLSLCLQNQLQQRHSLLSMRFLIIRFLSLEGITFPQRTGRNPKHKLWDPYEGSRCF